MVGRAAQNVEVVAEISDDDTSLDVLGVGEGEILEGISPLNISHIVEGVLEDPGVIAADDDVGAR